jgi:SAM-dependent methyltransferase
MSRYHTIYRDHPEDYDALVRAEDCDGALRAHLRGALGALTDQPVLELGVGTGRVTRWLLEAGARVRGYELSPAMVDLARARLGAEGHDVSGLAVGDAYAGEFGQSWAAAAVAGWVFGHAVSWHPDDWRDRVRRALDAMRGAVIPGGRIVVIETLGTGHEVPTPSPTLAPYFALLESEGFARTALRTDYAFNNPAAAERASRFFFGDAMGDRVRDAGWSRVPECTGVWCATR